MKNIKDVSESFLEAFGDEKIIFWELDKDLRFIYLSENIKIITGQASEFIINKKITEFISNKSEKEKIEKFLKEKIILEETFFDLDIPFVFFGKSVVLALAGKPHKKDDKKIKGFLVDITQCKQAEVELLQRNNKYKTILEVFQDGILELDAQQRIVFISNKLMNVLGYSYQELIGSSFFDFVSEEEKENVVNKLESRKRGIKDTYPLKLLAKDGTLHVFLVSAFPLIDANKIYQGSIGYFEKIKKNNSENNESLITYAFEQANDGICIVKDDKMQFANVALCNFLGYTVEEVVGLNYNLFVSDDSLDVIKRNYALRKQKKKVPSIYEAALKTKEGKTKNVEFSVKLFEFNKDTLVVVVIRDIGSCKEKENSPYRNLDTADQVVTRMQIDNIQKEFNLFLFESQVIAIIFDKDKKVCYFNKRAFNFINKPQKTMIGSSICDFISCFFYNSQKKLIGDCTVCRNCELMNYIDEVINSNKIISNVALEIKKSGLNETKDSIKINALLMPIAWNNKDLFLLSFDDESLKQNFEEYSKTINAQLAVQNGVIEKKNLVLKEIISMVDEEKSNVQKEVNQYISNNVLPIVEKLKLKADERSKKQIALLEKSLADVFSSFSQKLMLKDSNLSPREREICVMIRNGLSSKEIASSLNISLKSVEAHRYNIRKKLNIPSSSVFNLTSYLQSN